MICIILCLLKGSSQSVLAVNGCLSWSVKIRL
nr:MAG TPA: hypothetical protein [Caudoviricetes sp.]